MHREFVPFDEEIIRSELARLPDADRAKLVKLMEHYENVGRGNPSPAQVDDYGDGMYRLRHIKSAYQGRLIFFAVDRVAGSEKLVILAVYKKQSQKTPASVLETARHRKKLWENQKRKQ